MGKELDKSILNFSLIYSLKSLNIIFKIYKITNKLLLDKTIFKRLMFLHLINTLLNQIILFKRADYELLINF